MTARRAWQPRGALVGSALLTASLLLAIPVPPAAALVTCDGLEVTILGTSGPDELIGTSGPDVIHGLGGDDVIRGLEGADTICGGAGADDIQGGNHADRIFGNHGSDVIYGRGGHDTIFGGPGHDTIYGGTGDDYLAGKKGLDNLHGGNGADTLIGNEDDDTLIGAAKVDEAYGGVGVDRCDGDAETACELEVIDFVFERFLINQAVPQADSSQPAGERVGTVEQRGGIVRAFISANQAGITSPKVHLYFRKAGVPTMVPMSGPATVPTSPSEGDLASTYNYTFDETLLEPGTEMYVIVDRLDKVFELNENNNRYPDSGWGDIDTRDVPQMRITVVPITIEGGASASVSLSQAEALLGKTVRVHPIGDYDIQVRANYTFANPTGTSQDWITLLNEMAQLREAENPNRQYHAFLPEPLSPGIGGIGYIGYPAAVSIQHDETIAHETGHNLSLPHNPCSGQEGNPDPNYPYAGGKIGTWGYDIVTGALYDPNVYVDLMTYCSPEWVSDYSFNNVLDYRSGGFGWEAEAEGLAPAGTGTVLQFSGTVPASARQAARQSRQVGLDAVGAIEQIAVVERAANLPAPGDHTLVGRNGDGAALVQVSFATYAIDHADGAHFIFSIEIPTSDLPQIEEWAIEQAGQVIASRPAASG